MIQLQFYWLEDRILAAKWYAESTATCSVCGVMVGLWPIEPHYLATGCSGTRFVKDYMHGN